MRPHRPRLPTWLLLLGVALLFAAAIALFVLSPGDDAGGERTERGTPARVDGELVVPDEDDVTDPRRRGDAGQDRLDPDAVASGDDDDGEDPARRFPELADRELGATFENLRGVTVALAPVHREQARTGSTDVVRPGGVLVTCSRALDEPLRATELAVLDRLGFVLERAGATVHRVDGQCTADRVAKLEAAQLAVAVGVVRPARGRAGTTGAADAAITARVLPAHPARGLPAVDIRAARQLATTIAAALGAPRPPRRPRPADLELLAGLGLVDLRGGGSLAYVELAVPDSDQVAAGEEDDAGSDADGDDDEPVDSAPSLDESAFRLAEGIASAETRST